MRRRPFQRSEQVRRRRILVIKLSALGDAVLMMPALFCLRENNKDAEIIFLGSSSNADFLKTVDALDRVELFSAETCLRLIKDCYDLIIDFDQWVRATAVLSALCRATMTGGFKTKNQARHFAYDSILPFDRKVHMARNFWNLTKTSLENAEIKVSSSFESDREAVRLQWGARLKDKIKDKINDSTMDKETDSKVLAEYLGRPYFVIHPGCGEHGVRREWPIESWVVLIQSIQKANPGALVVVTGRGDHEKEWGENLAKQVNIVSTVNSLSFHELMMTLTKAQRIIASNTGVMHLADYLNDFVVALEGPTDSALWGPLWRGKNRESPLACAPCLTWGHDYGCSDPVCLKAITPKEVFEAL